MIGLSGSVKQDCADVVRLHEIILLQDFFVGSAGSKKLQHVYHTNSEATYARTPATFIELHCNPFE